MDGRALLLLVPVLAGCATGFASSIQGGHTFGAPTVTGRIEDKKVSESSGVAPSRQSDSQYYTFNDSGDSARFFRFTLDGKLTGEFNVSNASNVDWEDMASARLNGKNFLYFGDIGDNQGRRRSIKIYRVPEPALDRDSGNLDADQTIEVSYPDEPHNAETLLVDPKNGDLTIVTKAANRPSMVFTLKAPTRSGKFSLTKRGEIKIDGMIREARLITGGAISPDGHHVVLRTYMGGYEFPRLPGGKDWWTVPPERVNLSFDLQGEGITYSRDGRSLVTSSELSPCQISRISIDR